MSRRAIDDESVGTELLPSGAAIGADAAATVVVAHHSSAIRQLFRGNVGTTCSDDTAWLVPADDRAAVAAQTQRLGAFRRAVEVQIAAAHARRLDFQDDIIRTGRRIGKLHQFELPATFEHYTFHQSA